MFYSNTALQKQKKKTKIQNKEKIHLVNVNQ